VPPLRELQLRFAAALFDDAPEAVLPWIRGDGFDPEARVGIYRNNLREGFIKALALEFPVIQRLVGDDYFRQLAMLFLADHPSRAGNLHHIGEPFAPFLRRRFESTPYSYLPDVASLEWAYQESFVAAEAPPLDLQVLRGMAPEAYAALRFRLHPACKLVSSSFPIVRIWSANQTGADSDEVIDLQSGVDFVLVRRAADGIEFHRLPPADFAFLDAIARGAVLADALEAAQTVDAAFDPGAVLRRFVALGVVTAIHASESNLGEPA
jgi:hypothetical protein